MKIKDMLVMSDPVASVSRVQNYKIYEPTHVCDSSVSLLYSASVGRVQHKIEKYKPCHEKRNKVGNRGRLVPRQLCFFSVAGEESAFIADKTPERRRKLDGRI